MPSTGTVTSVTQDLRAIGVHSGAVILVHTSLRSLRLGREGAAVLWESLLRAVGTSGAVLVPTLSYESVTADNPHFDVRSTPSCVGTFPEWVRRRPGIVRSVHPTHSVAGFGAPARELLSGHVADRTPAGANSPFRRLREEGGLILMIGCGLRPNTSMHGVEELVEPPYLFAGETAFTCTDATGQSFTSLYRCHGHFPQFYERIDALLGHDELRHGRVAGAETFLIHARPLWTKARAALRRDADYFTHDAR